MARTLLSSGSASWPLFSQPRLPPLDALGLSENWAAYNSKRGSLRKLATKSSRFLAFSFLMTISETIYFGVIISLADWLMLSSISLSVMFPAAMSWRRITRIHARSDFICSRKTFMLTPSLASSDLSCPAGILLFCSKFCMEASISLSLISIP